MIFFDLLKYSKKIRMPFMIFIWAYLHMKTVVPENIIDEPHDMMKRLDIRLINDNETEEPYYSDGDIFVRDSTYVSRDILFHEIFHHFEKKRKKDVPSIISESAARLFEQYASAYLKGR